MTRPEACSLADNVGESDYPETGRAGHIIHHTVQLRSECMSLHALYSIYRRTDIYNSLYMVAYISNIMVVNADEYHPEVLCCFAHVEDQRKPLLTHCFGR